MPVFGQITINNFDICICRTDRKNGLFRVLGYHKRRLPNLKKNFVPGFLTVTKFGVFLLNLTINSYLF